MPTKTKKAPAAAAKPAPDVILEQSSTPQEMAPTETMGAVVAEVDGPTPAATSFSPTAPTTEAGNETPQDISKIIQYWVDEAERWLWKTPRQAMLHGDYETFLSELKKKL